MTLHTWAPAWPAFILLSFLTAEMISAQPGHHVGLQGGIVSSANRDELASPLRYTGNGPVFGIRYGFEGLRNDHDAELRLSLRSLVHDEQLDSPSIDETSSVAVYRYTRRVWSRNSATIYAGGFTDFDATLRDYSHGGTYWEGYSAAGPAAAAQYRRSPRDRARITLSVPLIAWAMRPPYSIDSDELYRAYFENVRFITVLGKTATPRSMRALSMEAEYVRRLTPWFEISLTYRFLYRRYDEPRPTTTAVSSLHLSLWTLL